MSSSSFCNTAMRRAGVRGAVFAMIFCAGAATAGLASPRDVFAAEQLAPRDAVLSVEPVTFRVVAVNPSTTKAQQVPVKIYLPQEVKPGDIIEPGGMEVEYDDQKSSYYLFKESVQLAPKETRVFEVLVKDVWRLPEVDLDAIRNHAKLVLSRLEKSAYYETGKALYAGIEANIDTIITAQNDDTLSRKQHVGAYRIALQLLNKVKQDIEQMEKLLSFAGGTPVPQMLQESPIKSDAQSTKTTWMLIFMIVIFVGLLGGLFFWTWHRKAQEEKSLGVLKQGVFPGEQPGAKESGGNKGKAA